MMSECEQWHSVLDKSVDTGQLRKNLRQIGRMPAWAEVYTLKNKILW